MSASSQHRVVPAAAADLRALNPISSIIAIIGIIAIISVAT